MASFGKQFYCFLLFILFFVCQGEARQSKFFSKYIHLTQNTDKNHVTLHSITSFAKKDLTLPTLPSPAPAPAPLTSYISNAPTPMGSSDEYGLAPTPTPLGNAPSADVSPSPSPSPVASDDFYYGLYAKDTNGFVSDTNTNVDNEQENDEFSGEEFNNDNSELLNSKDSNKFVDSYPDNLNENELGTTNQEGYNNNLNNFDVGYTSEPQGMSDTRLVDNGKYYYGAEQENAVPIGQQARNNNDGGYSGKYDPKSKYEFDTMEEYEKQEGYTEYPQEFNP